MGQAISSLVTKGGNTVEVFNSSDRDKPITGDIVILAVYYPAVADVLAQRGQQLAGKIVVDITNWTCRPSTGSPFLRIAPPPPRSPPPCRPHGYSRRSTPPSPARWPPAPSAGNRPPC